MSRKNKGWQHEPVRHRLAAQGVKTNLDERVEGLSEGLADNIEERTKNYTAAIAELKSISKKDRSLEQKEELNYYEGLVSGLEESAKLIREMREGYLKRKVERVSKSRDKKEREYIEGEKKEEIWLKSKYLKGKHKGLKVGRDVIQNIWDEVL